MPFRGPEDGVVVLRELASNPEEEAQDFSNSIESLRAEFASKIESLESQYDKKVEKTK